MILTLRNLHVLTALQVRNSSTLLLFTLLTLVRLPVVVYTLYCKALVQTILYELLIRFTDRFHRLKRLLHVPKRNFVVRLFLLLTGDFRHYHCVFRSSFLQGLLLFRLLLRLFDG